MKATRRLFYTSLGGPGGLGGGWKSVGSASVKSLPGGTKGRGPVGAPTHGLGRFFRRTRHLLGAEPMFWPHKIEDNFVTANWNNPPFIGYQFCLKLLQYTLIGLPVVNCLEYYGSGHHIPCRAAAPGMYWLQEIQNPDWRIKREMVSIEQATGPRPFGYNRYLDCLKGLRVSDPSFKPYVPSEHGEGIGPHAGEIIAEERARHRQAVAERRAMQEMQQMRMDQKFSKADSEHSYLSGHRPIFEQDPGLHQTKLEN